MNGSFTDPFNLDGAQARLKLQEQVLQALQQQAQGEIQPVGSNGGVARVSPWQALAKVFSAYSAKKQSEEVTAQKERIAQGMQGLLTKGFQDYQNTLSPRAVEAAGPPTEEGIPAMKIQPGDPQAAVLGALSSQHPVLQKFGGEQMKHLNDLTKQAQGKEADYQRMIAEALLRQQHAREVLPKDLLGHINPNAIPAMLQQGVGAFQPKPQLSFQGERWWETGSGTPQDVGGITFGKPVNVGGDLYQGNNATGQVRKLDNAPKVTVNANKFEKGQIVGLGDMFKNISSAADKFTQAGNAAWEMNNALANMQQLEKNGIFSNVTTGPAEFFSNLGQALGFPIDKAKLGNTTAYNAVANELWVKKIAGMQGGMHGVTEKEGVRIQQILPQAAHSPEARKELFQILIDVNQRTIDRAKAARTAATQAVMTQNPALFDQFYEGAMFPAPNTTETTVKPTELQPSGKRSGIRIIGVTQ